MPLTITRKLGETLHLILEDDREVIIQLEERNATQVKLTIEAPKSIQILRGELVDSN